MSTLAQVYDHLLVGAELTRMTDFGSYLKSLCLSLAELQPSSTSDTGIALTCEAEQIITDLDTVTSLGIVVAELVTNSFEHAFPSGKGSIGVSVRRDPDSEPAAILIIRDDGVGFDLQAGSKRHGLGLVRRLVEQCRGTVAGSERNRVWTIQFATPVLNPTTMELSL